MRAWSLCAVGALADDFLIARAAGVTHVINAPSPAATSSLALARMIVDGVCVAVAEGSLGRVSPVVRAFIR